LGKVVQSLESLFFIDLVHAEWLLLVPNGVEDASVSCQKGNLQYQA
jgi:hypothetical protein